MIDFISTSFISTPILTERYPLSNNNTPGICKLSQRSHPTAMTSKPMFVLYRCSLVATRRFLQICLKPANSFRKRTWYCALHLLRKSLSLYSCRHGWTFYGNVLDDLENVYKTFPHSPVLYPQLSASLPPLTHSPSFPNPHNLYQDVLLL